MKVTLNKFSQARENQATIATDQELATQKFQAAAQTLKEQMTTWQDQLEQTRDAEAAKQQVLDRVANDMKANLEAQSAPAPVVAGENTEVSAP
jgi:membrane-bound lytic murein transglycosylase